MFLFDSPDGDTEGGREGGREEKEGALLLLPQPLPSPPLSMRRGIVFGHPCQLKGVFLLKTHRLILKLRFSDILAQ